eukprot:m.418866 g.418866  ORF g.418866 m.418866 type:complete len:328 (-) comp31183_c0_seq1:221-1204(-)
MGLLNESNNGVRRPGPQTPSSSQYHNSAYRQPRAAPPDEATAFLEREIMSEKSGTQRAIEKATVTWASTTFIIIYCFMMAYSIYFNGGIESFTVNPMIGPSAVTLDKMGANNAARIRYNDEWWRFITPIFLHAGLVHLGFNVYVQYQIGTELEAMWGSTTWVVIFLLSGAGGNLASAIFLPTTIGVGASGSIMGMLGAWMLDLIIHWSDDDAGNFLDPLDAVLSRKARKKTILMLVVNIIITMCLSIVPMVDWAAHVGGTVFGIILGAHFFGHDVIGACSKTATLIISLVMLIALTVWGFWYFYSVVDPCPDHVEGDPYTNYLPPTC